MDYLIQVSKNYSAFCLNTILTFISKPALKDWEHHTDLCFKIHVTDELHSTKHHKPALWKKMTANKICF